MKVWMYKDYEVMELFVSIETARKYWSDPELELTEESIEEMIKSLEEVSVIQ